MDEPIYKDIIVRKSSGLFASYKGLEKLINNNPTLTTKQAADFLGVAPKTMANWRAEGTGPHYTRFLNQCRYTIEDLKDFMKKKSKKFCTSYYLSDNLMFEYATTFFSSDKNGIL